MKSKVIRHTVMTLLVLFVMTSLSCERDQFIVPESEGGEPVEIILGFELPQQEENAVTRTLTAKDEHHIKDFYLLIFNETGERVFGKYYSSDEMNKSDFSGNEDRWASVVYYDEEENKYKERASEQVDSTHGFVIATGVTGICYIFGFANIGDYTYETVDVDSEKFKEMAKTLESTAVDKPLQKGLTSTRHKLDRITTLSDLYKVKMDAMASGKSNILDREEGNLTYSGAWHVFANQTTHVRSQAEQGKVTISKNDAVNGVVDLRGKGMIYLRTLTAHINFYVKVNDDVFSDFKPEYWQVVNLPRRAYLMDETGHEPLKAEIEFGESVKMNHMLHDDGKYTFDFWMFENHKEARKAVDGGDLRHSLDYAVVGSRYLSHNGQGDPNYPDNYIYETLPNGGTPDRIYISGDEVGKEDKGIINYYNHYFGEELTSLFDRNGKVLSKLKTVYGYGQSAAKQKKDYNLPSETDEGVNNQKAADLFQYDKREYQVKRRGEAYRLAVWNRTGDLYPNSQYERPEFKDLAPEEKNDLQTIKYDSKKFVYADDKATYVVIRGRLKFANTEKDGKTAKSVTMINYASAMDDDGYLTQGKPEKFVDGYADVTITIHLGNFGPGKWDNFDILRNNEYNYFVEINGLNSVYTRVESTVNDLGYYMKKQPGIDGSLDLTKNNLYYTDAHFCQFNMMLTKSSLQNFYFVMNTPFCSKSYTSVDINAAIDKLESIPGVDLNRPETYKSLSIYTEYANNPDFTWFKFRPCYDQSGMTLVDEGTTEDENKVFNAAKEKLLVKNRKTLKWNYGTDPEGMETKCPKWNLFDFMIEMRKLNNVTINILIYLAGYGNEERQTALRGRTDAASVGAFLADNPTYLIEEPFTVAEMDAYFESAGIDSKKYKFTHKSPYTFNKVNGEWKITENSAPEEEYWYYLDSRIHRMFYTVYLDEYYYYEAPNGLNWDHPYWKYFANQPDRYVNFGYFDERRNQGYIQAPDMQSEAMISLVSVIQPSIQTFYSTERFTADGLHEDDAGHKAIGLEHYNETHNPRWIDTFNGYANEIYTDGMGDVSEWYADWNHLTGDNGNYETYDTYNGWKAAWRYITHEGVKWSDYVSDRVFDSDDEYLNGIQNNVAMKLNPNRNTQGHKFYIMGQGKETSASNDNQYLAGAIRMCMNRNRDVNGNDMIDADELKWFLPSSRQLELAGIGHYSLETPLLDYNKMIEGDGSYRFPNPPIENYDASYLNDYHFVSSDYHILLSEEMANSPNYDQGGYVRRPYEMRCMRNLGGEFDANGNLQGTVDRNISWRPQTLLYTFDYNNRRFDMLYFDNRTIRGLYYDGLELKEHFMFSTTNLPYKSFKVAQKVFTYYSSKTKIIQEILKEDPCKEYSDDDEGDAGKNSWRTPNHAEYALMVLQLRQYNWLKDPPSTYVEEVPETDPNPGPWFFDLSAKNFYTCTSWNFTGYGARYHLVNKKGNDGWGIHTTNIDDRVNHPGDYEKSVVEDGSTIYIRCVKDIR